MEMIWKNKKILIADDSEISFIILKKNLEAYGAEILWIKDGQELVDLFEKEKDIDLILMDISMPRLDGLEATRILRKKGLKLPIIAQSSFTTDSEINSIFEAGCNTYISKPIQKEVLFELINSFLAS